VKWEKNKYFCAYQRTKNYGSITVGEEEKLNYLVSEGSKIGKAIPALN
jgi:hypothetical protein